MRITLARRVRIIERREADRPPDPATLCPVAWTARFEAHRPENATALAAARRYETTCKSEHLGHVAMGLYLEAGFDTWDGKNVTMPPSPTDAQAEANRVLEQLLACSNVYQAETNDRFPMPYWGI
ncbi:MAG TPA: hypothetical protein PKE29_13610 [Phycisphaerales bacterium]|nr:hypothetical protein [Phycisphaerales bacterium]